LNWKLVKTNAPAAFFGVIFFVALLAGVLLHPRLSQTAKDCPAGYDEMCYGDGAYACKRSDGFISD
jgi:hypothetical protein